MHADAKINAKRFAIEEQVMILIATQQPMAHDLRLLASILEVSAELERMGDYAKGIATINIRMGDEPLLKPLIDIPRMAQKGADMLHRALTAFVNEDVETARAIPAEDDEVDGLYNQVYRELMTFVMSDPKNHRARQLAAVDGAQPGALCRPGHQYLRADGLHRHRRDEGDRSSGDGSM